MSFKEKINLEKCPKHVAIIMDGNGRWAKKQGKQRIHGHRQGAYSAQNTVEAAIEIGIKNLTLYAFSTENWKRPKLEVDALMSLLVNSINNELEKLVEKNIRLHTIGDEKSLPRKVKSEVERAKKATQNNTGMNLIIALSYSSRWEITKAIIEISKDIKQNIIQPDFINESLFEKYLQTSNFPDPELLIRTSGEIRISNFLLWQISYSELMFTEVLWPDFGKEDFFEAIYNYQQRERRFGKTSEQITEK